MPLKLTASQSKKKPPPRPPPPNLNKSKSKSTHIIHKNCDNFNLIDWSPPNSLKSEKLPQFGGSVSSSFSSSTSSLASIKKSIDYDAANFSPTLWSTNSIQQSDETLQYSQRNNSNNSNLRTYANHSTSVPSTSLFGPTIIRPRNRTKPKLEPCLSDNLPSLPMPTGPPPSPPQGATDVVTPYGIALYQFPATQPGDLGLEVDDIVILIRRINKEWLYGQVNDQEGIFPQNFIEIINPLNEDSR